MMRRFSLPDRRVVLTSAIGLLALIGLGTGLAAAGVFSTGNTAAPPPVTFETTPAAEAMAGALEKASATPIPTAVSDEASSLTSNAPSGQPDLPGDVSVNEGRLLLSNLGPADRAIYLFPTAKGGICFVITGLSSGCKLAFPIGQPATVDGSVEYYPSSSGPPTELAGLTKDGVTGVQVVVAGTPHDAVFGNDAWYYRFPDNQTPATAATDLIVTLQDGSTVDVPTEIAAPSNPSTPTSTSSGP
jgi:hypothetical protein